MVTLILLNFKFVNYYPCMLYRRFDRFSLRGGVAVYNYILLPVPYQLLPLLSRSEEPVDTEMDISTGHVVLVRELLPSLKLFFEILSVLFCLFFSHPNALRY